MTLSTTLPEHAVRTRARQPRKCAVLLTIATLAAMFSGSAFAACIADNTQPAGQVTFTPPARIMLPSSPAIGSDIWTSPDATPPNAVTLFCTNGTAGGLENAPMGMPGTDPTLFPTIFPWLSYRIWHPDSTSSVKAWPNQLVTTNGGSGNAQFINPSKLDFVVTGTIPPGTHQLPGGLLVQWDVDTGGGKQTVEIFNIATTTITFVQPCTVAVEPTTVVLHPVPPTAFNGQGSTAAKTPFLIRLTHCPTGMALSIKLATNNANGSGSTGVIKNDTGTGMATRVGVQVLDGNSDPVDFRANRAPIPEGHIAGPSVNLPFFAQYYQTSGNGNSRLPTPGAVHAEATYTLTYQ